MLLLAVEFSVEERGFVSGTFETCDDTLPILERLDEMVDPVLLLRVRKENGSRVGLLGVSPTVDVELVSLSILLNISILFCTDVFLEPWLKYSLAFPLARGDSTLQVE